MIIEGEEDRGENRNRPRGSKAWMICSEGWPMRGNNPTFGFHSDRLLGQMESNPRVSKVSWISVTDLPPLHQLSDITKGSNPRALKRMVKAGKLLSRAILDSYAKSEIGRSELKPFATTPRGKLR